MSICVYKEGHIKLTKMQLEIMTVLKDCYLHRGQNVEGINTTDLLDILVDRYGFGKREWQGSLKGLGKKGYVTYGNNQYSCDGGVIWLNKAVDFFNNF